MAVDQIGGISGVTTTQKQSFKGEGTQEVTSQPPSDSNGAKFFAVATSIAAVVAAGIALKGRKSIKSLEEAAQKLTEENKALKEAGQKITEPTKQLVSDVSTKITEKSLATQVKPIKNEIAANEAIELVKNVQTIKQNAKPRSAAHKAKQAELEQAFRNNELKEAKISSDDVKKQVAKQNLKEIKANEKQMKKSHTAADTKRLKATFNGETVYSRQTGEVNEKATKAYKENVNSPKLRYL